MYEHVPLDFQENIIQVLSLHHLTKGESSHLFSYKLLFIGLCISVWVTSPLPTFTLHTWPGDAWCLLLTLFRAPSSFSPADWHFHLNTAFCRFLKHSISKTEFTISFSVAALQVTVKTIYHPNSPLHWGITFHLVTQTRPFHIIFLYLPYFLH